MYFIDGGIGARDQGIVHPYLEAPFSVGRSVRPHESLGVRVAGSSRLYLSTEVDDGARGTRFGQ